MWSLDSRLVQKVYGGVWAGSQVIWLIFKQWLLLWVDKTGEQNEYRKTNWETSQDNIKVEEYYDLKNQQQKVENSAWHQAVEKIFG